jgi:hypothetical protein
VRCFVARSLCVAALASTTVGCFAEPPPVLEPPATTSGGECEGEQGCACYGNGTCDAGLECNPDVQLCIPELCMPGELACVCDDASCDDSLACDSGLCVTPGGSSDGDDDPDTGTSPDSGDADSDETSGSTGGHDDATESETTPSESSETSPDDSSGGDMCTDMACAPCVECVDTEACAVEFMGCDAVNGCATIVDCMVECGLGIDCFDNCCEGISTEQLDAVNALLSCKSDECLPVCDGVAEFDLCP